METSFATRVEAGRPSTGGNGHSEALGARHVIQVWLFALLRSTYRAIRGVFGLKDILARWTAGYCEILLVELEQNTQLRTDAAGVRKKLDSTTGLGQMLEMELQFLDNMTGPALDAKLDDMLTSFRGIAGEEALRNWEAKRSALFHHSGRDEQQIRHFVKRLTIETFKAYHASKTVEDVKSRLYFMALVGFSAGIIGLLSAAHHEMRVVYFVLMAGLAGAFLSIFQRISAISNNSANVKNTISLVHAPFGLYVSLLFGTFMPILAVILISSGTLHGLLLPRIDDVKALLQSYGEYKTNYMQKTADEVREHLADFTTDKSG